MCVFTIAAYSVWGRLAVHSNVVMWIMLVIPPFCSLFGLTMNLLHQSIMHGWSCSDFRVWACLFSGNLFFAVLLGLESHHYLNKPVSVSLIIRFEKTHDDWEVDTGAVWEVFPSDNKVSTTEYDSRVWRLGHHLEWIEEEPCSGIGLRIIAYIVNMQEEAEALDFDTCILHCKMDWHIGHDWHCLVQPWYIHPGPTLHSNLQHPILSLNLTLFPITTTATTVSLNITPPNPSPHQKHPPSPSPSHNP